MAPEKSTRRGFLEIILGGGILAENGLVERLLSPCFGYDGVSVTTGASDRGGGFCWYDG